MEYELFKRLTGKREQDFLDYKEACWAFDKSKGDEADVARGELAKDICAMANNGDVTSYILIGVSDDGLRFTSVTNDKLTDDNLQSFCKGAISPPPQVRLHRDMWPEATSEHVGKSFVTIEVGPHPRQAFYLNRDFVVWGRKQYYRHNEVWIRRGATSDIAHPREVARLVAGEAPIENRPDLGVALKYRDSEDVAVTLPHVVIERPTDEQIDQWVAEVTNPIWYMGMTFTLRDLDTYRSALRAYFGDLYAYEEKRARVFPLGLVLRNDGTYPADDINIAVEFPADFALTLDDEDDVKANKKPSLPPPPTPEAMKGVAALAQITGQGRNYLDLVGPIAARYQQPVEKPKHQGPLLRGNNWVQYMSSSLLHDDAWTFPPFPLCIPPGWMGRRIEATCQIKARQQPETRIRIVHLGFSAGERIMLSKFFPKDLLGLE